MDRDAVKELARHMITECAPDELELFDSTADEILEDLPRAVAGDGRRDKATASGIGAVVPDMVKLALYLANHLVDAATGLVLEKAGEGILERRRLRKGIRKGRSAESERIISIEIKSRTEPEAGIEIVAFIPDQAFPVNAQQAAGLIAFIENYLVTVRDQRPTSPNGHRPQN
jgi:hypothetical protein